MSTSQEESLGRFRQQFTLALQAGDLNERSGLIESNGGLTGWLDEESTLATLPCCPECYTLGDTDG